jgi:ABC-type glycerol-3-phosphate transport system substrate-binding protein
MFSNSSLLARPINRRSVLAGSALLTLMAATGCVPKQAASGSSAAGNLRFSFWGPTQVQANYTNFVKTFEQSNSGIKMSLEPAEYAAYLDRMATQAAAKRLPDVFWVPESQIATYASQNVLLDLDSLDKGTVDYSQFSPGQVDSWRILGGKQYSVVFNQITPVIQLNKDALAAAGVVTPNDEGGKGDDLGSIARDYTKAKGGDSFGMAYGATGQLHTTQWLRQHGAELFDKDGKLGFDAAVLGDWFAMWEGWIKDGAVMPAAISGSVQPVFPEVADRTAIYAGQSNQFTDNQVASKQELVMHLLPTIQGAAEGHSFLWYNRLCISATATDPALAGRFVDFFINSPAVIDTVGVVTGPPSNPKLREQALAKAVQAKSTSDQKVLEILERDLKRPMRSRGANPPGSLGWASLLRRAGENITTGGVPIDQAVKSLMTDLQRGLDAAR